MPTSSAEPFHLQVRAARRAAHWSQSELAARAGCRQSQISEFEAGVRGKVARETVVKLAELLGLEAPGETAGPSAAAIGARARCPNFECPSNLPYWVGGQLLGDGGNGVLGVNVGGNVEFQAVAEGVQVAHAAVVGAVPLLPPPFPGRSRPSISRNRREVDADGAATFRSHKGAEKEAGRPRPPRFDFACLRAR